jgi:formiminotetrahydrofolate cyclodeaminase
MLDWSVRDFLARLGDKEPTPGGGSAAGVAAALAVGLGRMALSYSIGKKALREHQDLHERLASRLQRCARLAEALTEEDAQAFELYQQTASLPDGPEKDQQEQLSLAAAINVPRELAKLCLSLLDDLHVLRPACTPWLLSDLKAAGALAVAAVTLCEYNVRINTVGLDDAEQAQQLLAGAASDVRKAQKAQGALEYGIDRT